MVPTLAQYLYLIYQIKLTFGTYYMSDERMIAHSSNLHIKDQRHAAILAKFGALNLAFSRKTVTILHYLYAETWLLRLFWSAFHLIYVKSLKSSFPRVLKAKFVDVALNNRFACLHSMREQNHLSTSNFVTSVGVHLVPETAFRWF